MKKTKKVLLMIGVGIMLFSALIMLDREIVNAQQNGDSILPSWLHEASEGELADNPAGTVPKRTQAGVQCGFLVVLVGALGYTGWAAIKFFSSAGKPEKLEEAKEAIKAILYGVVAVGACVVAIVLVVLFFGGGNPFTTLTTGELGGMLKDLGLAKV